MKKIMAIVMPVKVFAAMIFSGFMILYMVSGILYAVFTVEAFDYSIPFVFVLQGLGLSLAISVIWGIFYSDVLIKKWRFFRRNLAFALSILSFLAVCFITFLAIPADWAKPWIITAFIITIGVIMLFSLNEMYYRKTGKHYTEVLKIYKENNETPHDS